MSTISKALIAIATTGALVMAASGCGGPSKVEQARAAAKDQKQQHDRCAAALEDFSSALSEIDSRLSVGLNYSEYGDRLGDAQVAYDRIDVERLQQISPDCLSAATSLEDAYNDYLSVLQLWGDCIDDYDCDFSAGATDRKAQDGWERAGASLEDSRRELDSMVAR